MIYFILLTGNVKDSVFLLVLWLTIAIKCTVWTTDKQKKNFIARYAACSSIQDITVLAPTIDYIWMIYLKSRESIAYCQTLISSGGAQLSFISWAHFVQYKTFFKKNTINCPTRPQQVLYHCHLYCLGFKQKTSIYAFYGTRN